MSDEQSENTQEKRGKADHLKPHWWKEGQSGNPAGRPKRPDIAVKIAKEMDELIKDGISKEDALVKVMLREALQGKPKLIEMLLDRLYGKVQQDVNVNIVPKMYGIKMPFDDD